MEVNLYRTGQTSWAIKIDQEFVPYTSIELAADQMLRLGIRDEEIDQALIAIETQHHTRANFGIDGKFIFTDGAKVNETFGST